MIPADVASRLQVTSDAALRPVAATQEISDKLAGLVAGQKVLAEVQALLPNGTYRALINQRNITLALPFSAKAGDSLELQVTETDGKLAFAVLSRPGGEEKPAAESVSTTLSRTGQLISTLYSGAQEAKGKAAETKGERPATEVKTSVKKVVTRASIIGEEQQRLRAEEERRNAELRARQEAEFLEKQQRIADLARLKQDAEAKARKDPRSETQVFLLQTKEKKQQCYENN